MSDLRIRPYAFQVADVEALLAHDMTGAVVAETGAGKTVIGAEVLRRSGLATKLIIALPGTHEKVWRATITGHREDDPDSENYGEWITGLDPEASVRVIDGSADGKLAMDALEWSTPGYYLMSPQIFTRWKPEHLRVDAFLVDEIHLLGNREAAGGKLLMRSARNFGHRIGMSGTMWRNKFENAWTLMRFLYPERNESGDIADIAPNRWIDNFCATKADHFAPNGRIVTGELNPGRLAEIVPCWRQHFKRAQCCEFHPEGFLPDLPAPSVIRTTVELAPAQKRIISQMERDYAAYLEIATQEWKALPPKERKKKALVTKMPVTREIRLSQMTLAVPSLVPTEWKGKRGSDGVQWFGQDGVHYQLTTVDGKAFMQQLDRDQYPMWDVVFAPDAESPKLDELIRIYEKVQEPVVAATNSRKFAEMIVPRLQSRGIRAAGWWGEIPQSQRDETLAAFKRGEYDIIVGVTEAIGTGIDGLQDASGVLVSLNRSRDLTSEIQLEGRLDRRGQKRKAGVLHYEILAAGSTDEDIIDSQLERRLKLNRSLRRQITRGVTS